MYLRIITGSIVADIPMSYEFKNYGKFLTRFKRIEWQSAKIVSNILGNVINRGSKLLRLDGLCIPITNLVRVLNANIDTPLPC